MAIKSWQEKYKPFFSAMLIDPLYDGSYKEMYPILNEIDCTITDLRYDEYIKACSLIYDPNSPLVREYSNLKDRKEYVNKELFKSKFYSDAKFEVELLKRVYRKTEWTLLCTIDNVFDEFTTRANEPIENSAENMLDADKMLKAVQLKTKYIDDMAGMIDKRENLYKKIFYQDEDLMNIDREVAWTPEMQAKNNRRK